MECHGKSVHYTILKKANNGYLVSSSINFCPINSVLMLIARCASDSCVLICSKILDFKLKKSSQQISPHSKAHDIAWSDQCKLLVGRKDVTIEQLNVTNENGLANQVEERRRHQAVERELSATIELNHVSAKANINALNNQHRAQLVALNHERKRFTESKLKMITVHQDNVTKSELDGLTKQLDNLLIRFNATKKVNMANLQGNVRLCASHQIPARRIVTLIKSRVISPGQLQIFYFTSEGTKNLLP